MREENTARKPQKASQHNYIEKRKHSSEIGNATLNHNCFLKAQENSFHIKMSNRGAAPGSRQEQASDERRQEGSQEESGWPIF